MADRDFKGVWIPKEVWLDERLNMLEKGILVEIDSLDRSDDGCWASNEHLANFCQCSVTKVATAVTKLVNLGYLRRESFDGRRRKLKSSLSFFKRQTFNDLKSDFKNLKDSNTNKENKKDIKRKRADGVDYSVGFEDFWRIYPRKVDKKGSYQKWIRAGADDSKALTETIIADVKRRIDGDWSKTETRYIPHPSTYLYQRRWEDEITPTKTDDDEYYPRYREYHPEDDFKEPVPRTAR